MRRETDKNSANDKKTRFGFSQGSRRRRVPTVFQIEACECGAACLSMILRYYRCPVPMETLRDECGVSRDGSTAADLVRAGELYGLTAKAWRKNAKALRDTPFPCIIHWEFNHFVVLEGIRGDCAYLNDPKSGRRKISMEDLERSFTGVALYFAPGDGFHRESEPDSFFRFIWKRAVLNVPAVTALLLTGLLLILPGLALSVMTQMFVDHVLLKETAFWISKILAVIGFSYAFQIFFTWIRQAILAKLKLKLTLVTGCSLAEHMLRLKTSFFSQRYIGDLSTRLDNNDEVHAFLAGGLSSVLLDIMESVFFFLLMVWYSPLLSLIGAAGIGLNILSSFLILRPVAAMNLKLKQDTGHLNARLCAGFSISSTIKASGIESEYAAEMIGGYAEITQSDQRLGQVSQTLSALPGMVFGITNLAVLTAGAILIIKGDFTTGMLTAFTMLLGFLMNPVKELISMSRDVQDMKAGLARVEDVENAKEDPRYHVKEDRGHKIRPLSGRVDVKDLVFGYNRNRKPLLNEISMGIAPGMRVAIVGGSGCGKSTALKLLSGILEPWSGTVRFDGMDIRSIPCDILTEGIAMVGQSPFFFSGSVRENLTFFNEDYSEECLMEAIRDAEADEMIRKLPYGLEHRLTEGGGNLSGGQRQRLEIARALYRYPAILILDEATAALDTISEKKIMENLKKRGCTCILAAHRLSAIRDCDMIVVLADGRIAEWGTHEALLEKNGIYAKLVE